MTACKRVIVHGTVQGVFYRDTCRTEAEAAGVCGWVRNLPDGTVEALFEGEDSAVEQLLDWARTGPPRARVERIEVHGEEPRGRTGFDVLSAPAHGTAG